MIASASHRIEKPRTRPKAGEQQANFWIGVVYFGPIISLLVSGCLIFLFCSWLPRWQAQSLTGVLEPELYHSVETRLRCRGMVRAENQNRWNRSMPPQPKRTGATLAVLKEDSASKAFETFAYHKFTLPRSSWQWFASQVLGDLLTPGKIWFFDNAQESGHELVLFEAQLT